MNRPHISLHDIFIFVEVAKRRGFTAAAEAVGLPVATISRRVSTLEEQLGLKLFNRSTRRIELTAAGAQYFNECAAHVEGALLAHEKVYDYLERPAGELRISAPPGLSALLPAMLRELHQQYPDVSYDIELGSAQAGLQRPGLDLMLRFGALEDSTLVQRAVTRIRWILVASRGYLERAGRPVDPGCLARHQRIVIGYDATWQLRRDGRAYRIENGAYIKTNDAWLGVDLAASGLGIACMPSHRLMAQTMREQDLEQVLPEWELPPITLYALSDTRTMSARARIFLDALARHLDAGRILPADTGRTRHLAPAGCQVPSS